MRETLRMMKSIITGKEKQRKEIDLIEEYQDSLTPNILAYMFVSNFGIITNISNNWLKLDDADKVSFCLQELDKALRTYKLDSNIKFITYFRKLYINRLRTETEAINTNKRKIHLYFNELKEEDIDSNLVVEDINLILDNYQLDKEERAQCLLLNQGYKIKEIAIMMHKSISRIYQINNEIRRKFTLSV